MTKSENTYTLLTIDAWKDTEGGWYWNDMHIVEEDIYIDPSLSNRALLAFMRRNHWLSEQSKGRIRIEDTGHDIEIQNKNTYEPIFAFRPQWDM